MDNSSKTLRELLDEMERVEQAIADHKQQVRDIIANNITEEIYTKLESYDLDAIDKISKRMLADILNYADQDTETEEKTSNDVSEETAIDDYISIPEIRSV